MIRPVVVVIGYNRIESLRRLLEAISGAHYQYNDIKLIISLDGGASQNVIDLANDFDWKYGKKEVVTHDINLGLRKHIIECGNYSVMYDAAIVFEDDILPSPYYYDYATSAVNYYDKEKKVFAISLYSISWIGYCKGEFIPVLTEYDAYFAQMESSWGECFIGKQWKNFEQWYRENENKLEYNKEVPLEIQNWKNSYCKYIAYYLIEKDLYYVTPYISLTTNCGDAGTHVKIKSTAYQVPMMMGKKEYKFPYYGEAQKYDMFYNNIDIKKYLAKTCRIAEKELCLDYYGIRRDYTGYKYCLSTRKLKYHCIKSFGKILRPWEQNIFCNINGSSIYLYDLTRRSNVRKRTIISDVEYDLKEISVKKFFIFGFVYKPYVTVCKIIMKVKKILKKLR